MLNVFKCPNCEKKLKTDQGEGQSIPCPYCKEVFTISANDAVVPDPTREMLIRLAIPLGYVLFVAVPLGLTLLYFATRDEKKPVAEAPGARDEQKPPDRPPAPRRRKEKAATVPGPTDTDPEPAPPARPEPAAPGGAELVLAPPPRALVEVFIAPEPHEIFWKMPLLEYSSKWQKVGAVEVRVAGVAVSKVPIIDTDERVTESAAPLLAILVEARLSVTGKKRALTSWTYGLAHYGVVFLENGKELDPAVLPPGGKPNIGLPFTQPLPDDGTPVRDVLLFVVPSAGSGELSLRLAAERCGEAGDIWFKIPAGALKK